MLNFVSAVLLLTLVGVVSPQCITPNDTQPPPLHPDLGHILPFSLDLFKELYVPGSATGNFFFSPFSIWNALVLAYFGSAGRTQEQLQRVLNLKNPADTLATYKAVDRLYAERQANTSEYVIDLANRVYVDESFPLNECVRGVLVDEVQNINFKQAQSAANTINSFVNESTRGKIPSIVTAGDVSNVPMVLVNAAYFKGFWLDKFKLSATTKENFFPTPDRPTLVDMMKQTGQFKIGDSAELRATVLELPYKGKAASMFVVLPSSAADATIDDVLARLNANTLQTALANLRHSEVILSIPKFKLEETIKDELKKALQRLGITDLFSSTADMSNYDETRNLVLRQGIHKAMVEVNEEGAEAAAVTVFLTDRIISDKSQFEVFTCDRPFLFFILDNNTINNLFMGVYRQPQN
ncbi:leukocyte elastase inhibitor-like [Homarus americanus]|uniref:leukocyte elastase inhibitor-like n=1 Tax=Homarus americanus TaxID=6706 RepID=UPI001C44111A|nr:leukocyte elastase inhibitor-like [Homarus americanus]